MAIEASATDRYAVVNGLRLHYLEWGEPTAPPIVMLHGLRSAAPTWAAVAAPLCARYRVLALDQRGRGESEWAADRNYRRDAYVADLAELVDQLGLERFILMGHSMGGANTLVYTARHPKIGRASC